MASLESELAAVRRKLEKAHSGEKDAKPKRKRAGRSRQGRALTGKKTKIKKKTKKGKNSSRSQNRPKSKVSVAVKGQKPQPPVAKAGMSDDKSRKTNASTDSGA